MNSKNKNSKNKARNMETAQCSELAKNILIYARIWHVQIEH